LKLFIFKDLVYFFHLNFQKIYLKLKTYVNNPKLFLYRFIFKSSLQTLFKFV